LAYVLVGYTVVMVLVQIRLLPVYLKLPFAPTFWSLAFFYAAVAAYALRWIQSQDPVGATPMDLAVLDATTLLIGAIALRSLAALRQGNFLPPPASRWQAEATQRSVLMVGARKADDSLALLVVFVTYLSCLVPGIMSRVAARIRPGRSTRFHRSQSTSKSARRDR
jgi:hypothetical protein